MKKIIIVIAESDLLANVKSAIESQASVISFNSEDDLAVSWVDEVKNLMYQVQSITPYVQQSPNYLFIKDGDYFRKLYFDQIQWIEAAGSYCYIHTIAKRKICLTFTLSELENKLPDHLFLRIHRSYIANIQHIDSFIGNMVCIGTDRLSVSRQFRSQVLNRLNVLGRTVL